MFRWFKRTPKPPSPHCLRLDDEGMRVFRDGSEVGAIRWDEGARIRAWKQDCFAVDQIWLGFDRFTGEESVCVSEDMENYPALQDSLPARFRGLRETWWVDVALPPFKTNHLVVWQPSQPVGGTPRADPL